MQAYNYHITVRFFGDLQLNRLDEVRALCRHHTIVTGLLLFYQLEKILQMLEHGRARLLYAGLKHGRLTVTSFIQRVRKVVAVAGFPVKLHKVLPHVTVTMVTRCRDFSLPLIRSWLSVPFVLDRIVLYDPFLSCTGLRYIPVDCQKRVSL